MSTPALSRTPAGTLTPRRWVKVLGRLISRAFSRRMRMGRDRRLLQSLPDYVLADMGLEKLEFRSGADGRRDVWVIPPRYY